MPFPPIGLPPDLQTRLRRFAAERDFARLYRGYDWGADAWHSGFPDILKLELTITKTARNNLLTRNDIVCVGKWGKHRNPKGIEFPETLESPLYEGSYPNRHIERDPLVPLASLLRAKSEGKIKQLGPTYLTKALRFALPSEYGAIDTRIARVVGMGDDASRQQDWLSLKVRNYGYGWFIPEQQSAWPTEYSTWINILRFFALLMNDSGRICPHPEAFVRNGLRTEGIWACADVEMALFAHASKCLAATSCER